MGRESDGGGACPDFVVIGHASLDLIDDGEGVFCAGGGVVYAGLTARNLGQRVGVVTSTGVDLDLASILPEVALAVHPSPTSTSFRNVYLGRDRQQYLCSRAESLRCADVPVTWQNASIVMLAPLADEVPLDVGRLFPKALVGASVQGWLREWDDSGRVWAVPWRAEQEALSEIDVVVVGEGDLVAEPRGVEPFVRSVPIVVLTRGDRGATVYWEGGERSLPAYPTREKDPTGAGDVFAAAFLLEYSRSRDPVAAADFANCVASFAVERLGTAGVPTLAEVEKHWGRPWCQIGRPPAGH